MGTNFKKLNGDWHADGGAPEPNVCTNESGSTLTFFLSAGPNTKFRASDRGEIFFSQCWRYRIGPPDDEGWYKGHCRFRCLAPEWGEFYEVTGDLLDSGPKDWVLIKGDSSDFSRHFLFYFKDETFECDAQDWSFRVLPVSDQEYERLRSSECRVTLQPITFLGILRDLLREAVRSAKRWFRQRKSR